MQIFSKNVSFFGNLISLKLTLTRVCKNFIFDKFSNNTGSLIKIFLFFFFFVVQFCNLYFPFLGKIYFVVF